MTEIVSADADVRAILADHAYVVPPAPPTAETGTLAWLRAHVARFCDGQAHDRRRVIVEREISGLDPSRLRHRAAEMTASELAHHRHSPFDVMPLAKRIPVAALAAELGITQDLITAVVDAVLAAASGYPNPDLAGPQADSSVEFLAQTLGPAGPEELANRIGLLMQACDATAALIGNALIAAFAAEDTAAFGAEATGVSAAEGASDEMIGRTIADDPPVLRTRRLSPGGDQVTVDISGCTFGTGRRPCPGADQATALAAGMLDALLPACELADQRVDYLPSPNLRMPVRLLVTGGKG